MSKKTGGIEAVEDLPGGIPLYIEDAGSVTCGAGLGGDFVTLTWGERTATFYLRDVLKAWVGTFEPSEAERIPGTDYKPDYPDSEEK